MLSEKARRRLAGLARRYKDDLANKHDELVQHWEEANRTAWEVKARVELARFVHRLAGSASFYGHTDVSDTASALSELLSTTQAPHFCQAEWLTQLNETYRQLCDHIASAASSRRT